MKTNILFLSVVLLLLIIPPNAALAVTLVPCGLNGAADCTLCHLAVGIQNIFDFLLKLILAACILGITISGVFYMVSSGSKKLIEQAKKSFSYSLTALVLLLCSWLIVNAVVNALGFKLAGGWSKFKCDTTQTTGPKPSGPKPSGPSGPKPSGPSGPAGTCHGIPTQQGIDKQCKDASSALSDLLACMKDKLPSGAQISSVSDSAGYDRCRNNYSKPPCAHVQGSCHYGGSCNDGSHGVDISTRNAGANDIMSAATNCGAWVKNERNHIHASMGQGCGCR